MPTYSTAQDIVNTALQELGLGTVSIDAGSADATAYQCVGLLNALGDEILRANDWQLMQQVMSFTGDGVTDGFPLPADFGRQINQTQWCSSNQQPMQGPLSASQWSWLQYGLVSPGINYQYRILTNAYTVYPVPGAGVEFKLYYISRNWVAVLGDVFNTTYKIVNADDVPAFERRLLIAGLKYKLWAAKGLDTTNLAAEYTTILNNEMATNAGAPIINLSGTDMFQLVGYQNIPDGSWRV